MTQGDQSDIIVANCTEPGCSFTWIGWRSKIAAQLHANKTGHIVDVATTIAMAVEPGQE